MDQNKIKKIAPIIIAIIAVGGVSFYGGMKYAEGTFSAKPEQRQQMFQQAGAGANGARGTRTGAGANGVRVGTNSVNGEIISRDDKSITIKLRDGGSKLIFFSDKTSVSKMAEGSQDDVVIGEQVMVNGSANSDGSITAQSIQVRPEIVKP